MAQKINVVGAGLVGSLASILLAKKEFDVDVFEGRPDMRKAKIGAGRSINLVITSRGIKATEKAGIKDKVMDLTLPIKGRMLHDTAGKTTYVPYGQNEGEVIYSISRGLLNKLLLEEAEKLDNVNIHFEKPCRGYDIDKQMLHFDDGDIPSDVVFGTDGAFSPIRKSMLAQVKNFNYSQSFLEQAYKELVIPPDENGHYRISKEHLHIWPRGSYMLMALPNLDGSFTCTLFLDYEGEESFAKLKTKQDVTAFFSRVFPDTIDLMPTLEDDFFENPTASLVTVKCNPWHVDGHACLMGDASHAIVPFFGQGMNSGFEDCSVLHDLLNDTNPDWHQLFKTFNAERKDNTDAIADMAVENFIEMRDKTADAKFQLKKQVGFELEKRFPDKFIPRYSMVMFHPDIPYSEAKRLSEIQDTMLEKLCASINTPDQTDWNEAEKLIQNLK